LPLSWFNVMEMKWSSWSSPCPSRTRKFEKEIGIQLLHLITRLSKSTIWLSLSESIGRPNTFFYKINQAKSCTLGAPMVSTLKKVSKSEDVPQIASCNHFCRLASIIVGFPRNHIRSVIVHGEVWKYLHFLFLDMSKMSGELYLDHIPCSKVSINAQMWSTRSPAWVFIWVTRKCTNVINSFWIYKRWERQWL
jgi:hypothetical protein